MSSESSLWFRVGYALEQARQLPSTGRRGLAGLRDRSGGRGGEDGNATSEHGKEGRGGGSKGDGETPAQLEEFLATGTVAVAARLLDRWRPGRSTSPGALARAAAAGAAAALLVELMRPLVRDDTDAPELGSDTPEHLLTGAGQGLVYGAVLEPWLPGSSLVKGVLLGSAEYALHPSGGLTGHLGSRSPLGRVPMVLTLIQGMKGRDRSFLEYLTFGVALAILYGRPSSNGMRDEDG